MKKGLGIKTLSINILLFRALYQKEKVMNVWKLSRKRQKLSVQPNMYWASEGSITLRHQAPLTKPHLKASFGTSQCSQFVGNLSGHKPYWDHWNIVVCSRKHNSKITTSPESTEGFYCEPRTPFELHGEFFNEVLEANLFCFPEVCFVCLCSTDMLISTYALK